MKEVKVRNWTGRKCPYLEILGDEKCHRYLESVDKSGPTVRYILDVLATRCDSEV